MKATKLNLVIALAILIGACAQNERRPSTTGESELIMEEESTMNDIVSSSAAVENPKDSTRKFIRTADLKFKVKNVIKSTYDIEDITSKHGGFVTSTELASNIDNVTTTAVSADSTLETTYYTVTNSITVRVPNIKLDTTLKDISRNIEFLDYRIIKAQDVALNILSNNLTQKRLDKSEDRLISAIDNRGKKLKETTSAEELLLSKQEQADNAKISNLSLADQIKFSTINLVIYERPTAKNELIASNNNIDVYTPGFGYKVLESLKFGWDILEGLLVFLIKCWGIFLFGFIAYFIYKKYKRTFNK